MSRAPIRSRASSSRSTHAVPDPLYDAAEDSELLRGVVAARARGRALDIGTGSGVLAFAAHERDCTVTALDVNAAVITRLRKLHVPFRLVKSDGLRGLRRVDVFDTITCNPPYLPNETDGALNDPALHGGPRGYEYIVRIIGEIRERAALAPRGEFLLLISTLTHPPVVEEALARNGFAWEIVAREKLFMEELFVYAARWAIEQPAEFIGRGARSRVYAIDSGRVAVKVSTPVRAANEARLLRIVNKKKIGPQVIRVEGDRLFMQRIIGEPFDTFFHQVGGARSPRAMRAARALFKQAATLDRIGLRKEELHRPSKNVLVMTSGKIVLLDFERSRYAERPGNVPQLVTWLAHALGISHGALAPLCAVYKKSPTPSNLRAIERALFVRRSQVASRVRR